MWLHNAARQHYDPVFVILFDGTNVCRLEFAGAAQGQAEHMMGFSVLGFGGDQGTGGGDGGGVVAAAQGRSDIGKHGKSQAEAETAIVARSAKATAASRRSATQRSE